MRGVKGCEDAWQREAIRGPGRRLVGGAWAGLGWKIGSTLGWQRAGRAGLGWRIGSTLAGWHSFAPLAHAPAPAGLPARVVPAKVPQGRRTRKPTDGDRWSCSACCSFSHTDLCTDRRTEKMPLQPADSHDESFSCSGHNRQAADTPEMMSHSRDESFAC